MPRLTGGQMVAAGLVLLVVGTVGSTIGVAWYDASLWAAPEAFYLLVDTASALSSIGAALLGGGLVVALVQRQRARAGAPTPGAGDDPRPTSG